MQHPSAVISPDATIHETAIIRPFAVIHPGVVIGPRVYVGEHAIIGAPPQHHGSWPATIRDPDRSCGLIIGEDTCIREGSMIHQGIVQATIIAANTLIMCGSHVAHDCEIGEGSTLGSLTALGGFTLIDRNVTFGQGVVTHPWTLIGEGSMIGLNSSVIRDVEPFAKVAGSPARVIGTNTRRLPGADADYDQVVLSVEAWERWSELGETREAARDAFNSIR